MRTVKMRIAHPEWLQYSKPSESLELYLRDLLPESIAAWMIVVNLKHPLRAIYGSDLKAALALLWQATIGAMILYLRYCWWRLMCPDEVAKIDKDARIAFGRTGPPQRKEPKP